MSEATPLLEIDQLSVHFGGLVAISQMTFDVHDGEIVSLIGPNGAGKTTAFNAITGYLQPESGESRYRGRALNGMKPNQIADLGVVRTFQKTSLFAGNTVFDNVLIGLHRQGRQTLAGVLLRLPGMRAEERSLRETALELLEFVGLDKRRDELASALPYGEQRVLEVAIGLAAQPKLLLLDEPASGMNPSETSNFVKMVDRIRARDITILLVEHDMRMVMGVSDRVVVLNQGEIIAEGPPAAIQRDPEVIRAYLGSSAANA
ncbi:MAG: ABC transporter ATP-binding protein [Gammaproteobacteria bacterium]